MSCVPRGQRVQISDGNLAMVGTVSNPRAASISLLPDLSPTEYSDGFTTFTPSTATTSCPRTSVTAPACIAALSSSFTHHHHHHSFCLVHLKIAGMPRACW